MPNPRSPYRLLERAAFAAVKRPAYLSHVEHMVTPAVLEAGLPGLALTDTRYYGKGRGRLATLYVAAFERSC